MSTFEWDPAWGTPEDHEIDTSIEKHDGYRPGEQVRALADGDESSHEFWFEGDEAVIMGFYTSKFRGVLAVLYFDGQDPMVAHTYDFESVDD